MHHAWASSAMGHSASMDTKARHSMAMLQEVPSGVNAAALQ